MSVFIDDLFRLDLGDHEKKRRATAPYFNMNIDRAKFNQVQPIRRDPCFLCGTRGDIGCKHNRGDVR